MKENSWWKGKRMLATIRFLFYQHFLNNLFFPFFHFFLAGGRGRREEGEKRKKKEQTTGLWPMNGRFVLPFSFLFSGRRVTRGRTESGKTIYFFPVLPPCYLLPPFSSAIGQEEKGRERDLWTDPAKNFVRRAICSLSLSLSLLPFQKVEEETGTGLLAPEHMSTRGANNLFPFPVPGAPSLNREETHLNDWDFYRINLQS